MLSSVVHFLSKKRLFFGYDVLLVGARVVYSKIVNYDTILIFFKVGIEYPTKRSQGSKAMGPPLKGGVPTYT